MLQRWPALRPWLWEITHGKQRNREGLAFLIGSTAGHLRVAELGVPGVGTQLVVERCQVERKMPCLLSNNSYYGCKPVPYEFKIIYK